MKTAATLADLRSLRAALPAPVGLVPTMGYLHEGHLSLVRRARSECRCVVVSIFVNPTQFGPGEDLDSYPRDAEGDLKRLERENVDLVWIPEPVEVYPANFQTWVTVEDVRQPLEGKMRPGHFRGVATVVAKLFNSVQPDRAYFGQKDAQQVAVIRQMTRDLDFPVEVVVCPIVREQDGLAMSSRNVYLSAEERAAATVLYRALSAARAAYRDGERDAANLRHVVATAVGREPLIRLQYVSCADPDTLEELESARAGALLSLAAFAGQTRLIDNLMLA